jgi:hypothetical protein
MMGFIAEINTSASKTGDDDITKFFGFRILQLHRRYPKVLSN